MNVCTPPSEPRVLNPGARHFRRQGYYFGSQQFVVGLRAEDPQLHRPAECGRHLSAARSRLPMPAPGRRSASRSDCAIAWKMSGLNPGARHFQPTTQSRNSQLRLRADCAIAWKMSALRPGAQHFQPHHAKPKQPASTPGGLCNSLEIDSLRRSGPSPACSLQPVSARLTGYGLEIPGIMYSAREFRSHHLTSAVRSIAPDPCGHNVHLRSRGSRAGPRVP